MIPQIGQTVKIRDNCTYVIYRGKIGIIAGLFPGRKFWVRVSIPSEMNRLFDFAPDELLVKRES
jgi:hypothetical protein